MKKPEHQGLVPVLALLSVALSGCGDGGGGATTTPPPAATTVTRSTATATTIMNSDWAMLHSYPRHYVAPKLGAGQKIVMDGKLDEPEWAEVPFSIGFVDITHHADKKLNVVPEDFQTSIKMRWDSDFLYVGAVLKDPFVYGDITGHNQNGNKPPGEVPYHNNDFEVFIDVSGTTEYYKEFEMSVLNSTYDVNWGVPDQTADICNSINPGNPGFKKQPWLPVCTNTTDSAYPGGTWTMWSGRPEVSGLRTATSYNATTFGTYVSPHQSWSLEIAFPIRSGPAVGGANAHGGLLSAAGGSDMKEFDPNVGDAANGLPRFWYIDFARAEHPRAYNGSAKGGPAEVFCPSATLNCSAKLSGYKASLTNPDASQCKRTSAFPTILGSDPFYGCYWEWVWQSLGNQAYMHRPTLWGVLQFANSTKSVAECRDIKHPVRYIAQQLHVALAQMKKANGTYTTNITELLSDTYCGVGCDLEALKVAASLPDTYSMSVVVIENVTTLSRLCTARPCYLANAALKVPCGGCGNPWKFTGSINENQYLRVQVTPGDGAAPCLPAEGSSGRATALNI